MTTKVRTRTWGVLDFSPAVLCSSPQEAPRERRCSSRPGSGRAGGGGRGDDDLSLNHSVFDFGDEDDGGGWGTTDTGNNNRPYDSGDGGDLDYEPFPSPRRKRGRRSGSIGVVKNRAGVKEEDEEEDGPGDGNVCAGAGERWKKGRKDAFALLMSSPERGRSGGRNTPSVMPRTPVKRKKKNLEAAKRSPASSSTPPRKGSAKAGSLGAAAGGSRKRRNPFAPSPGRRRRHKHPNHHRVGGHPPQKKEEPASECEAEAEASTTHAETATTANERDRHSSSSPPTREENNSHSDVDAAVAAVPSSLESRCGDGTGGGSPSRFVSCPICDGCYSIHSINAHVDECLARGGECRAEDGNDGTDHGDEGGSCCDDTGEGRSRREEQEEEGDDGDGGGEGGEEEEYGQDVSVVEKEAAPTSPDRRRQDLHRDRDRTSDEVVAASFGGVPSSPATAASTATSTAPQPKPSHGCRRVTLDNGPEACDGDDDAAGGGSGRRIHGEDRGANGEEDEDDFSAAAPDEDEDDVDLDAPAFDHRGRNSRGPKLGATIGGAAGAAAGARARVEPCRVGDGRSAVVSTLTKSLTSSWGGLGGRSSRSGTHAGGTTGADRRGVPGDNRSASFLEGVGGRGSKPSFSSRLLRGVAWPWTRKRKRGYETGMTTSSRTAVSSSPKIITIDDSDDEGVGVLGPSSSAPSHGDGDRRKSSQSLVRDLRSDESREKYRTGGTTSTRRRHHRGHSKQQSAPVISLLDDDDDDEEEQCSLVDDGIIGGGGCVRNPSRGGSSGRGDGRVVHVDRRRVRTTASSSVGRPLGGSHRRKRSSRTVPSPATRQPPPPPRPSSRVAAEEVITIKDSSDEDYDSDESDDRLLDAVLGTGTPTPPRRNRRARQVTGAATSSEVAPFSAGDTSRHDPVQQSSTAAPSTPPTTPPTAELVGRAVGYVARVKRRFLARDEPEEYRNFLSILRSYQHSQQRRRSSVLFEEVKALFRRTDHADLLSEFTACFCPNGEGEGDGKGSGGTTRPGDTGARDAEDAARSERRRRDASVVQGMAVPAASGSDLAEDAPGAHVGTSRVGGGPSGRSSRPCSPSAEGMTASPAVSLRRTKEAVVATRITGMAPSSLSGVQQRDGICADDFSHNDNDTCCESTATTAEDHLTTEKPATKDTIDKVGMGAGDPTNGPNDSVAAVAAEKEATAKLPGSSEKANDRKGTRDASEKLRPIAAAECRTMTTVPGSPSLPSPTTLAGNEEASMESSSPCDDDDDESSDGRQFLDDFDSSESCESSNGDSDSDYRESADGDSGDSDCSEDMAAAPVAKKRFKKEVKVGRLPKSPSSRSPKKASSSSSISRLALRGCGRLVWVREGQDGEFLHPAFLLSHCDDDENCDSNRPKGTKSNGSSFQMMKNRWASNGGIKMVPNKCIVWDLGRRRGSGKMPLDERKPNTLTKASADSCSIKCSDAEELASSEESMTAPSRSSSMISNEATKEAVEQRSQRRRSLRYFHPSLGNAVWRALNTSEPRNATCLLTEMACLFSTVPRLSSALASGIHDMLLNGPRGDLYVDNDHTYHDGNKVELVSRYGAVAARKGLSPPRPSLKRGPTAAAVSAVSGDLALSWKDIEACLTNASNANRMNDDDMAGEADPCSLQRTFEALQRASFALEYVLSGVASPCGVVSFFRGAEPIEALKTTARCTARCWMRNGTLILSEGGDNLNTRSQRVADDIGTSSACAMAAKRCLSALGRLTCHVSHCFCLEGEMKAVVGSSDSASAGLTSRMPTISPKTVFDCASLFREVISNELNLAVHGAYSGVRDIEEGATRGKKERRLLILSFLSTLDVGTEFSGRFRFCLGKALGFSEELSIMA